MNNLLKKMCCVLAACILGTAVFAQNNPVANNSYVADVDGDNFCCYFTDNNTFVLYPEDDMEEVLCGPYFYNSKEKILYFFESFDGFPDVDNAFELKFNASKNTLTGEIEDEDIKFVLSKKGDGKNPLLGKTYTVSIDDETMEFYFADNNILIVTLSDDGSYSEVISTRYVYDSANKQLFFFGEYNEPDEGIGFKYKADKDMLYGSIDGEYVEMKVILQGK